MVTRWWWVRHGPTHEKTMVGWRDVPADLSDDNRIARLHAFLPEPAVVVSSDLIRAAATADRLEATRVRLPHERDLREFNFGAWDGLGFSDIMDREPELSRRFWETPGDVAPPDGESWHQVAARVDPVVSRLTRHHAGRDIVAVAHIGVIMTQIGRAAGLPPAQAIGHRIDPLSVTCLQHGPEGWSVERINHAP